MRINIFLPKKFCKKIVPELEENLQCENQLQSDGRITKYLCFTFSFSYFITFNFLNYTVNALKLSAFFFVWSYS